MEKNHAGKGQSNKNLLLILAIVGIFFILTLLYFFSGRENLVQISGTDIVVTTLSPSSSECSLEDAIEAANTNRDTGSCPAGNAVGDGADRIIFDPSISTSGSIINASNLVITEKLDIVASGKLQFSPTGTNPRFDLSIDGGGAGSIFQINGSRANGTRIIGLAFTNALNAIEIDGADNVVVLNAKLSNIRDTGIDIVRGNNFRLAQIYATSNNTAKGILVEESNSGKIEYSLLEENNVGIELNGSISNVDIRGLDIIDSMSRGIILSGTPDAGLRNTISDVKVMGTSNPDSVGIENSMPRTLINPNTITDNANVGIRNNISGIEANISNNNVSRNGSTGIENFAESAVMQGNTTEENRGHGIYSLTENVIIAKNNSNNNTLSGIMSIGAGSRVVQNNAIGNGTQQIFSSLLPTSYDGVVNASAIGNCSSNFVTINGAFIVDTDITFDNCVIDINPLDNTADGADYAHLRGAAPVDYLGGIRVNSNKTFTMNNSTLNLNQYAPYTQSLSTQKGGSVNFTDSYVSTNSMDSLWFVSGITSSSITSSFDLTNTTLEPELKIAFNYYDYGPTTVNVTNSNLDAIVSRNVTMNLNNSSNVKLMLAYEDNKTVTLSNTDLPAIGSATNWSYTDPTYTQPFSIDATNTTFGAISVGLRNSGTLNLNNVAIDTVGLLTNGSATFTELNSVPSSTTSLSKGAFTLNLTNSSISKWSPQATRGGGTVQVSNSSSVSSPWVNSGARMTISDSTIQGSNRLEGNASTLTLDNTNASYVTVIGPSNSLNCTGTSRVTNQYVEDSSTSTCTP